VRGDADRDALIERVAAARRTVQAHAVRSENEAAGIVAAAARLRASRDTGARYATRGGGVDDAELLPAVAAAFRSSTHLRLLRDPDLLRAVGEVVGASLSSSAEATPETRGLVSGIRDTVGRVVGAIDNLLGLVTAEALGALNQVVRGALAPATALSFGDIVAYRDPANGAAIRRRVLDRARAGGVDTREPITIVAHSLGGLVVLDMLLAGDLRARRLVTAGSQPAMFHVLHRLGTLAAYAPGRSTPLPPAIASWVNLWHPMDPLAFVAAPVFSLANGELPRDVRIDTPLSTVIDERFWLHSAYWHSDALIDAVLG
jgi:hypothetical protein